MELFSSKLFEYFVHVMLVGANFLGLLNCSEEHTFPCTCYADYYVFSCRNSNICYVSLIDFAAMSPWSVVLSSVPSVPYAKLILPGTRTISARTMSKFQNARKGIPVSAASTPPVPMFVARTIPAPLTLCVQSMRPVMTWRRTVVRLLIRLDAPLCTCFLLSLPMYLIF